MTVPGWGAEASLYSSRSAYHAGWRFGRASDALQPAQFSPEVSACYRKCGRQCPPGIPGRFECLSLCVLDCGAAGGGGDDVVCNLDPTACMS